MVRFLLFVPLKDTFRKILSLLFFFFFVLKKREEKALSNRIELSRVIESIKAGKKLSESRFAPSLSSVGRTTCSSESSSLESSSPSSILVDDQKSLDGRSPLPLPPALAAGGGGGGGGGTRKEYRVGVPAGQRSVYDMFKKVG